MTTAEKESNKSSDDVSTFLSNLNTAISFRSSSKGGHRRRDAINRFYYTVGTLNILLEKSLNVENISQRDINKVPHCKTWHEGIISVRGTIVPVINMAKFLQDEMHFQDIKETKKTHLLFLNHSKHAPIALLIDKLPETANIKKFLKKKAPESAPDWYNETFEYDIDGNKNTIMKVDHNQLLNQLITQQ